MLPLPAVLVLLPHPPTATATPDGVRPPWCCTCTPMQDMSSQYYGAYSVQQQPMMSAGYGMGMIRPGMAVMAQAAELLGLAPAGAAAGGHAKKPAIPNWLRDEIARRQAAAGGMAGPGLAGVGGVG